MARRYSTKDGCQSSTARSFNIPKLNKTKNSGTLDYVSRADRESQELMDDVDRTCFFSAIEYRKQWRVAAVRMVRPTSSVEEQYRQKRSDLKKQHGGHLPQEVLGFYICKDKNQAKKIARYGIRTGSSHNRSLGNPRQGVYLFRYVDVALLSHMERKSAYVFVFKVNLGRTKKLPLSDSSRGCLIEPNPHYDAHISHRQPQNDDSTSIICRRSQMYLYEYTDDAVPSEYPRQCLPFAFLEFIHRSNESRSGDTQVCSEKASTSAAHQCVSTFSEQDDTNVNEVNLNSVYKEQGISKFVRKSTSSSVIGDEPTNHETCQVEMTNELSLCGAERGKVVVSGFSERRPAFGNGKDECSSDAQSMFQKTVQETEEKQSIPDSLGLMSKPVADVRKSGCSASSFKLGTATDVDDCDLSKQNPVRGTSESRQNIAESVVDSGKSLFPMFFNFQDPRFYKVYGPSDFHLDPSKIKESFSPMAENVDEDPRFREPEVSCAHSDVEENQSVSEQSVDPDKTIQEEYFTFSRDPRLRHQKKTISSTLQSKTSKEHAEVHSHCQPHQFQSTSAPNVMTVINKLLRGKGNLDSQQVQRDPMESWGLTWNENFDVSDQNESTDSFHSHRHMSDLTKHVQRDARNSIHMEPKSADRRFRMKDTVSSSHVLPMKDHSAVYQSESSQRREQPPSPLPSLLCMSSPQAAQLNTEGLASSVGSENPRVQATTSSSSMLSEMNSTAAASQDYQSSRLDILRSFTQHAVQTLGLPAPQDNQSAPQDNQPSRLDILRSFTQLAIQNVGLSAHPTKNTENTSDTNLHDIQSGQKSTFKSVTPEIPGSTALQQLKVPLVPQTASGKVIGDHQHLDFQSGQETISKSHTHVIPGHGTWQPSKTSAFETVSKKSKDSHQHYGVNRVTDFSSQHTQSANKISPPRLPNQVRLSSQQMSHPAETVCRHSNEILKSVEQKTNKVNSLCLFVPPLASIEGDDRGEMYESVLLALKESETEEGDKPPDDGFQGVLSTSGTSNHSEQNSEAECTQLTGRDSAMVTGDHVSSSRQEESSQQESAQGMADSPVVVAVRLSIDGQQQDSSTCENTQHQKHEQTAAARSVETSQQSLLAAASVPMDTVTQNQECCNMDCSEPELTESTEQEQNLCMNGRGNGKPQLDYVAVNFSCTTTQPDAVSDNQTKSASQHLLSCHVPTEEQKDSMIDNDQNTALLPTDATGFSKEPMQQEAASTSENAENLLHVSAEEEHHSVDESDQTTPVLPDTDRELDKTDENDQNTASLPGAGREQNKNQEQQNTIAEMSQHTLSQSTSQNKQQDCMDENVKSSPALSDADTNLNKNPEQQDTVPESQESISPDNSESRPGSENHSSTASFLLPETELSASSPDSISENEKVESLSIACAVNMSAAEIDTNSSLIQQPRELSARQSMAADHKAEASTSRPQSQKLKEKETDLRKPQDWLVNQGEETDSVANMDTAPDQTSNGVRASQPEDMAAAFCAPSKDLMVTTPPARETASTGRALPLSSLGLSHWMEALLEPKLNPLLTLVDLCEAYLGKADFDNCVTCQKVVTYDSSEEQEETMEASQSSTELASSAVSPASSSEQVKTEAAETETGTYNVSQITSKDKNQTLKDDPAELSMNDTSTEDSLQNSSAEDSLQNSPAEDSLQNSPAEDSLQNSPAEDSLQNSSDEDSLQNSSDEDSLQNSSDEDSLQNSSDEDSLQNSQAENSLQNSSDEESLQNSQAEDSLQNSSDEDSLKNPPAEDSLQNSPAEDSLQKSPAEDSLNNPPAEDRLQKSPAEDRLQKSPAEDSRQKSPAEDSLQKSPAEDSLRNLPAEDSLRNLPAEDSLQNSPAEDSLQNSPAEDSLQNSPAEDSLQNSPAEDCLQKSPAEDSLQKSPAEDSLQNPPAEDSLQNSPAEDCLQNSSAEDSLKNSPAEDSMKNLPEEDSLQNSSAEDSLKNLPAEDSLKNLPAEDSLKNLPAEHNLKNLPAEDSIQDQSQYTSADQLELSWEGQSAEHASKDQSAETMTKEHSAEDSRKQQLTRSSLKSWSLRVAEKEDTSVCSVSKQKQKSGRTTTGFFNSKRRYGISNSFSCSFLRNIHPRSLATSSPSGSPTKSVQFCKKLYANKEENLNLSEMPNDSEKETETGSPDPTLAMRKDASFFTGQPLYPPSLPVESMFPWCSAEGNMQSESPYHAHHYQHVYQEQLQTSASECAERGSSLQQSGKKDIADYFQDIIGEKRQVASDTMPKMESERKRIKHDFSARDNFGARWEQRGSVSSKAERAFHGRGHEQKRKSGSGETKWKNDQESASSAKKQKLSTDRERNGCTSTDSSEMNNISKVQQRSADIERKLHISGHVLDKTQTTHRAVPSKTDIRGGHDTTSKANENVSPGGKSETKMSTLGRGKKISDMPWLFSVHRLSRKLSSSDHSGQRLGDKRPLLSKTDESIVDPTRKRRKDEGYDKDDKSHEIRDLKLGSDRHHAKLRKNCAVSPMMNSTEDYANRRRHRHSSQHDRVKEYSSHGVQKGVCTFSCAETDRCSVSVHSSSPAVVKDPEMLENTGSLSSSQENTMYETSWSFRTEVHQEGVAEKCSTELSQEAHAVEQDLGSASYTVNSHQHVNSNSERNELLRTSACSSRVPDLARDAWFSNSASHNTQGPDDAQSQEHLACYTSQASLTADSSASVPTPVDTNRNDFHIGSISHGSLSSWCEESFTEEQMKLELKILDDYLRLVEVISRVDRQADTTLGSLPVTNLSDPDLKTLRKSLKGVLKDYNSAAECSKRDKKGKPHQRIPQELLFSDEINQLYTREGVFVVLISSIPVKSYCELLEIKAAIEDAIKRGYTVSQSKMPDQIAQIQKRRKILMENHTGKVGIKLLNQLKKHLSFYTVCQNHMRRVLGHETVEKLVVFRSSFKAVRRHLQIVQREMSH